MARRKKTPPDFLTPENTDNDVSAIEKSLGIAPRNTAPASVPSPSGNPLVDLQGNLAPETVPASRAAERSAAAKAVEAEDAALRENLTGRDFFTNVAGLDFSFSALADMAREMGFEADADYRLPEIGSEEFKALTQDIPEDYWDVFDNAVSADHAQWLAEKARRELEAERELAAYGGLGIAGRLAVNLLDPVGLALGAASGGLGFATKGTRITRAIKAAGLAGAENAALQAALSSQRVEQDVWDVAAAGLAGVVLGAGASTIFTRGEKARLMEKYTQVERIMDRAEAEEFAKANGIDLSRTKWGDSGGAARVDESVLLRPLREYETGEMGATEGVGQSAFAKARFDIASVLRGDPDEEIRGTLGLMVGEPVGVKSGVNHIGASERARRIHDSYLTAFYSVAEPAYAKWARAKGYNVLDMQTRDVRDEFMSAVGRYVRGTLQTDDENIIAVGKVVREQQADVLRRAKAAQVDGFEDVPENPNYLSRVFNLRRWSEYERRFGTGKMEEAFEAAIVRGMDDVDPDVAKLIAKGYVKRLKMQAAGFEAEMLNGLRLTDVDYVKGLLKDVQADQDTIEYVVGQLQRSLMDRGTGSSSVRHGKRRVQLDETTRVRLVDQHTGEQVEIGIDDIFESNVEKLFGRYTRTMSGHIGLAEIAKIRGKRDFDAIIQNIKSKYEHADPKRKQEIERVISTAQDTYKLVTGMPIEDAGNWHRYGRLARDLNFLRVMNQVGFAQVPDMAGWMAGGYAREAMRHFPEIRKIMKAVKAGEVEGASELARELKAALSVATDFTNNTAFSFADDLYIDGITGKLGAVEHAARIMGRGTQRVSGMKFINELNQMMAGHVVAQKLLDVSLGRTSVSPKRLLDMGLDEAMVKRIGKQAEKHVLFDQDGTVKRMNVDQWSDPKAREAFLDAAYREARRIVQEEDLGETHPFMHKTTGKLLLQFRRFTIAAYTKQLLKGVHMRDARVATNWILSMMLGGTAFVVQQSIRLSTADAESRKRYLKQYGGWEGMFVRAGLSRATFSSLAPGAIDTVSSLAVGQGVFNTRSTGLDGSFLTGNPTWDMLSRGVGRGVISGPLQAALRGDRQFTQGDAKALMSLLPFNNMVGVQQLLDIMAQQLPKQDKDNDPDSIDWF